MCICVGSYFYLCWQFSLYPCPYLSIFKCINTYIVHCHTYLTSIDVSYSHFQIRLCFYAGIYLASHSHLNVYSCFYTYIPIHVYAAAGMMIVNLPVFIFKFVFMIFYGCIYSCYFRLQLFSDVWLCLQADLLFICILVFIFADEFV